MGHPPVRVRRCGLLHRAAGGAVLAGAVLTGCRGALRRAATAPRHLRRILVMQADTDSLLQGTTLMRPLEDVLSSYTAAHTGIVKLESWAGYATNVPDMLEGSGSDIVAAWYAPPHRSADVLVPMDELIQHDDGCRSACPLPARWPPDARWGRQVGSRELQLPGVRRSALRLGRPGAEPAGFPVDLDAINARTKCPTQAWELLPWLTYDRVWQRALMKTSAMPPARTDPWEERISTVHAIVPPLRTISAYVR